MKNILLLIVFSTYTQLSLAQQSVVFEMKLQPNSTYSSTSSITSAMELDFTADEAFLQAVKENGVELPMKVNESISIPITIVTAEKGADGKLPAQIRYGTVQGTSISAGTETSTKYPYSEAIMKGFYEAQNKFTADTIIGSNLTQQMRDELRLGLSSLQPDLNFPSYPLKEGDTFNTSTPFVFPVQDKNIEMTIDMQYLLTEIKDGKAYFTLTQKVKMNMAMEDYLMEATGQGDGSCTYDIQGQYISLFKSTLPIRINMQLEEGVSMQATTKVVTEQRIVRE